MQELLALSESGLMDKLFPSPKSDIPGARAVSPGPARVAKTTEGIMPERTPEAKKSLKGLLEELCEKDDSAQKPAQAFDESPSCPNRNATCRPLEPSLKERHAPSLATSELSPPLPATEPASKIQGIVRSMNFSGFRRCAAPSGTRAGGDRFQSESCWRRG